MFASIPQKSFQLSKDIHNIGCGQLNKVKTLIENTIHKFTRIDWCVLMCQIHFLQIPNSWSQFYGFDLMDRGQLDEDIWTVVMKYLYRLRNQRQVYLSAVEKKIVLNQNLVTVSCSCVLKSKPATVVLFLIFFGRYSRSCSYK